VDDIKNLRHFKGFLKSLFLFSVCDTVMDTLKSPEVLGPSNYKIPIYLLFSAIVGIGGGSVMSTRSPIYLLFYSMFFDN
jgi:hypothetical protein